MKKYLFYYLSLLTLISILAPCRVYAVDISVGATTWHVQGDQKFTLTVMNQNGYEEKTDSAFLYGPILSVKFNDDFNLTFVYLYGKFDTEEIFTLLPGVHDITKYKLKRKDSDLALNYRLNNYFKAFLGLKYIGFNVSLDKLPPVMFDGTVFSIKHNGYGPGLGFNATLPIIDNIFVLGTISGFYLWGKESKEFQGEVRATRKTDSNDYGINSTLSLAYYIAPASTTISLGGRFQYIKINYKNIPAIDSLMAHYMNAILCEDSTTKFYGITLTATYSFGI